MQDYRQQSRRAEVWGWGEGEMSRGLVLRSKRMVGGREEGIGHVGEEE